MPAPPVNANFSFQGKLGLDWFQNPSPDRNQLAGAVNREAAVNSGNLATQCFKVLCASLRRFAALSLGTGARREASLGARTALSACPCRHPNHLRTNSWFRRAGKPDATAGRTPAATTAVWHANANVAGK
jgi:hypothetical protein